MCAVNLVGGFKMKATALIPLPTMPLGGSLLLSLRSSPITNLSHVSKYRQAFLRTSLMWSGVCVSLAGGFSTESLSPGQQVRRRVHYYSHAGNVVKDPPPHPHSKLPIVDCACAVSVCVCGGGGVPVKTEWNTEFASSSGNDVCIFFHRCFLLLNLMRSGWYRC